MNREPKEYREEQGSFPYKTYDEILSDKRRQESFRHGMVVISGIFLMLCAVIVGISMVWSNSANPLELFRQTSDEGGIRIPFLGADPGEPPAGTDEDFTLPTVPKTENTKDLIYVSDVSDVVKKARSSVVGIEAEVYSGYMTSSSSGSGIILSEDGYIITNSHVIHGSDSINVTLDNGNSYAAFVIGDDSYSDIAIIKIDANGLVAAELGDSDTVEVGQPTIAIGNPTGMLQGTATFGIVSGVNRSVTVKNVVMNLLQTDAAINTGNSGGPLLNQQGQVIGINSVKVSVDGYEGLGFAIPINTARPIAEELIRNGSVAGRPMLGVHASKLSAMASSFYGLPQGLYLTYVEPGSGAARAGLQVGDVITALNGVKADALPTACLQRDQHRAGEEIAVTFCRRGLERTVKLTLMDQRDAGENINF